MMHALAVGPVRHARVPPYGVLVAGLAILVVILMGASLAIGYAPLDLIQAFRDVFKGKKTLAALVRLICAMSRWMAPGFCAR